MRKQCATILGKMTPSDDVSYLVVVVGVNLDVSLPDVEADGYDLGRYQKLCSLKNTAWVTNLAERN